MHLRDQTVADPDWCASPIGQRWTSLELDQSMFSIHPMPDGGNSLICLNRFVGRPPFDERERTLVDAVWQPTLWPHRRDL